MKLINQTPAYANKQGSKINQKVFYSNSRQSQCRRILSLFPENQNQLNTFFLREAGIMHPAGRIKDLRNKGYRIKTFFIKAPDANGVFHRIGLYLFCGQEVK